MYFLKQFFSFVEVQLTNHNNYSGLYYSLISSKCIQSCSCLYCVIQRTSLTAKGFFISAQSDYDVLYCFSAYFLCQDLSFLGSVDLQFSSNWESFQPYSFKYSFCPPAFLDSNYMYTGSLKPPHSPLMLSAFLSYPCTPALTPLSH